MSICVDAHVVGTGTEITNQVERLDCLVVPVGTGATISGCARVVKKRFPHCKIVGVDALGSQIFSKERSRRNQKGMGSALRAEELSNLFVELLDEVLLVNDEQAFTAARVLNTFEGIAGGGSSGSAFFGALVQAQELESGSTILFISCDSMNRYIEEYFSKEWLKIQGLLVENSIEALFSQVSEFRTNEARGAYKDLTVRFTPTNKKDAYEHK
jgi:cysteine synthase